VSVIEPFVLCSLNSIVVLDLLSKRGIVRLEDKALWQILGHVNCLVLQILVSDCLCLSC